MVLGLICLSWAVQPESSSKKAMFCCGSRQTLYWPASVSACLQSPSPPRWDSVSWPLCPQPSPCWRMGHSLVAQPAASFLSAPAYPRWVLWKSSVFVLIKGRSPYFLGVCLPLWLLRLEVVIKKKKRAILAFFIRKEKIWHGFKFLFNKVYVKTFWNTKINFKIWGIWRPYRQSATWPTIKWPLY